MNTNITFTAHLTDNHQLKAADAMISKLRFELGQERSYTEELQEELERTKQSVQLLTSQLEAEREKVKKLYDKYSRDVQEAVKLDDTYQRLKEKITESEEESLMWKRRAEVYLAELIKLRDGRDH